MRIALDAMGGDHAPAVTVEGAVESVIKHPDVDVILTGNETSIAGELSRRKFPKGRIFISHASEVVAMDDSPSLAIRRKKDSSMRKAFELVKHKEADAVVTAGNSGAAMALAVYLLGTSEGVQRPAIATTMPSLKKPFVLLDAGANVDCSAENLLQFALMGDAYSRLMLGRDRPRVALLSIGEEAVKGNELTKETYKRLRKVTINFTGNIEGKDIFAGDADVVVCDGFVGNIVLKTSEGLVEAVIKMLRREISGLNPGKLGFLLLLPAMKSLRKKTDYDEYGGAPLLGLNGTCIISHGRSSAKAIRNAVKLAAEFSRKKVYDAISEEIKTYQISERAFAAG